MPILIHSRNKYLLIIQHHSPTNQTLRVLRLDQL
jgi:hypothetical protein